MACPAIHIQLFNISEIKSGKINFENDRKNKDVLDLSLLGCDELTFEIVLAEPVTNKRKSIQRIFFTVDDERALYELVYQGEEKRMSIFYWLILLFLVTYEPIYGYFDYQRFKGRVQTNPLERMKYYKKVMLGLWMPTILIIMTAAFGPITFHDIGLKEISINTTTLGPWVTYIAFGIVGAYLISLLYYLIGSKISQKMRNEIVRIKKEQLEKSAFNDIIPRSQDEKRLWTYVSWTAGITEEIIYRGFLIFVFTQLFPDFSLWLILILSSVIFGLAHTYQGFLYVIKTSIIGLFFAIIYIGFDSIIPLIVLHFLIDYVGKIGDDE